MRDAVLTPTAAVAEDGEGRHVLLESIRWGFTLPPNGGWERRQLAQALLKGVWGGGGRHEKEHVSENGGQSKPCKKGVELVGRGHLTATSQFEVSDLPAALTPAVSFSSQQFMLPAPQVSMLPSVR